MAEMLRCGVIGAGAVGLDHLNSLLHCRRATAVALAESSPARAKEAADRFKIPRSYSDYRDLLDQPDIDAVTIALPNYLHAPVAIDALKARKHVMVEKPFATSAKEAAKVIETAKKARCVLMVGQNYRFDRHTQAAKSIIERGDLGEIYHARAFWLMQSSIPRIGSWFTQKRYAGGGCAADLGVHMLDACLFLLNDFDVVSVSGQAYAKFGPRGMGDGTWGRSEIDPRKPFDVDDFCVALLRMRNGRTMQLDISWAASMADDGRDRGIDLFGTTAGMKLFPARLFRHGPNGHETIQLNVHKPSLPEDRIQNFVNSVLDGKKPAIPLDQSLKVQKILDAIYASSASRKEVQVK